MKYLQIAIIAILLNGCVYFNEDGISNEHYRECVEYYDAQGKYNRDCEKNLIDYDEIPKKLLK